MGEMTVDPLALLAYADRGGEQVAVWRSEAGRLRDALGGLATALPSVTGDLADRLEDLSDEQDHQDDSYVRAVAVAVLEAEGYGHVLTGNLPVTGGEVPWPDGPLTVSQSVLDGIAPATRYEAARNEAARNEAETGVELLTAAGVFDALDGVLDVDDLTWIAYGFEPDGDLATWLEQTGPKLEDPLYAAAFYNELGPDGLDALAALFLAAGISADIGDGSSGWNIEENGPDKTTWLQELTEPFTHGLADATTTGALDLDVLADLMDFTTEHDRLAAAVMFSAEGDRYDDWTLGLVAEAIFESGHLLGDGYPDSLLTEADALMMRAFAENPGATWYFVHGEGIPLFDANGEPILDDDGRHIMHYEPIDERIEFLLAENHDMRHLEDIGSWMIQETWLGGRAAGTGHLVEFWAATAYLNLIGDTASYEIRDFNGEQIDGHPWRQPGLLLGDPRFLEEANYEGWWDPTTQREESLYTMWIRNDEGDLEPAVFYQDSSPEQISLMVDLLPGFAQLKAWEEVRTGRDPITGEPINRFVSFVFGTALGGFLLAFPILAGTKAAIQMTRRLLNATPQYQLWAGRLPADALQSMNRPIWAVDPTPSYRYDQGLPQRPIDGDLLDAMAEASMTNPTGHLYNCTFVSVATYNRLSGNWDRLIEAPATRVDNNMDMIHALDGTRVPINDTGTLDALLQWYGHGSQAILAIKWGDGSGHVMNVFNHYGNIYYYDAQVAEWVVIDDVLKQEEGEVIGAIIPGY